MNSSIRLVKVSCKCALLSSVLFWCQIILTEEIEIASAFTLCLISVPVTFIISIVMISVSISPLLEFEKKDINFAHFYNKYFPYYAIIFFSISFILISLSNFEQIVIIFFLTAYITAMMSWQWLFRQKIVKNQDVNINETHPNKL